MHVLNFARAAQRGALTSDATRCGLCGLPYLSREGKHLRIPQAHTVTAWCHTCMLRIAGMTGVHLQLRSPRMPALAPLLLLLATLALATPRGALAARSLLAKNVAMAMPATINNALLDTYYKGANATQFSSLWSSPNVTATLRQDILLPECLLCLQTRIVTTGALSANACAWRMGASRASVHVLSSRAGLVAGCRAAKTLVYRATLPYSGVSQVCLLEPTTVRVTLAGSYTAPGAKNTSYSASQVWSYASGRGRIIWLSAL